MEFISCTFLSDHVLQHFYSTDAAIGFIDKNSDETESAFFSAFIRVNTPQKETKFWFDRKETLLENLMNL